MKTFLSILALLTISATAIAQNVDGSYSNKWECPSTGEAIFYELTLNTDGTFIFHSKRTYFKSIDDKSMEAQGTWQLNGFLLVLSTSEDGNELASELNRNKARYISISSRNPNFNLVTPSLKFYVSDVFYAKNMELFKTETSVTANTD